MTAQPYNRFVFVSWSWHLPGNGNQALGERTNHSENERIYHPNFVWYVETSSAGDINLMSDHLIAFELTNQLLCMDFPSLERKNFKKDLKSTLPSSLAL